MIDVALLGCGGSMPIPNRYLTSLLINYRGRKVLLDCGEGTQVSIKLLGWGFKTIDIICITHFHADHIVGLPGLLSTIGNSGRVDPIYIIGPQGLINVINGLRVIVPYLPYELIIIEDKSKEYEIRFDKDKIEINSENPELTISTINLDHSSLCLGYSFYFKRKPTFNPEKASLNNVPKKIWNKLHNYETVELDGKVYNPSMVLGNERKGIKVSYVTDTRPIMEIISFITDSNLFICEGMYGNDKDIDKAINNKHMTFTEAAKLAYEGHVDELILTHFSPVMSDPNIYLNDTKVIFQNTTIGYDRLVRNLKFK